MCRYIEKDETIPVVLFKEIKSGQGGRIIRDSAMRSGGMSSAIFDRLWFLCVAMGECEVMIGCIPYATPTFKIR